MAVITEFFKKRQDGANLVRTYSDNKDKNIKKIGKEEIYDEAIDVGNLNSNNEWVPILYSYEETDEAMDVENNDYTYLERNDLIKEGVDFNE